jgi:hypothetical protein
MENSIYLCILQNLQSERKGIFAAFHRQYGVFSFDYRNTSLSPANTENIKDKIRDISFFIIVLGENIGDTLSQQDMNIAHAEWKIASALQKRIHFFIKSTITTNSGLKSFSNQLRLYHNPMEFVDAEDLVQQISRLVAQRIRELETSREVLENLAIPDLLNILGKSENKYDLDTAKENYKKILTLDSHIPLETTAECLLRISRIEHVQGNFSQLARYANEAAPLYAYSKLPIKAINSERLSILSLQIGRNFQAHVDAANELLNSRIPKIRNKNLRALMEGHFRRDICNSYFDLYEMAPDIDSKRWLARQIREQAKLSENLFKDNYVSPTWSIDNIGEFTLDDSLIFIPIQNTASLYAYEGNYDKAILEIERLKNSLPAEDFLCQAQARDREATIHYISNNPSAALASANELLKMGQEKEIYYQIFRSKRLMKMIKDKYRV